jgi:hypothetical protein
VDPKDIAQRMRGNCMQVGCTWLQDTSTSCKLKKYQEDGDPNIRDVRVDDRRATSAEQRWLG